MLDKLKQIAGDLFTGKDGQTHDIGRWSWAVSTVSVIGGGIWNAIHAGAIDVMQFAQALAVIVAAHGGALWAKRQTEPDPKDTQ